MVRDFHTFLISHYIIRESEDLPDSMFLPFISHIRVLEIYVNPYTRPSATSTSSINSLRDRLTSLSPTLEHLKFSITILVDMRMLDEFFDDLYPDEVWRFLDSIPTRPFSSSRLQRVDMLVFVTTTA